jgi:hypothetical protein
MPKRKELRKMMNEIYYPTRRTFEESKANELNEKLENYMNKVNAYRNFIRNYPQNEELKRMAWNIVLDENKTVWNFTILEELAELEENYK